MEEEIPSGTNVKHIKHTNYIASYCRVHEFLPGLDGILQLFFRCQIWINKKKLDK